MTLLLVVVLFAIGLSIYQNGSRAQKEKLYKQKTKTNIELQRTLFSDNLNIVLDYVEQYDKTHSNEFQTTDSVIIFVEKLFEKYNMPDFRSPEQILQDRCKYSSQVQRYIDYGHHIHSAYNWEHGYDAKDKNADIFITKVPLLRKIFLEQTIPPTNKDILFGTPNTEKKLTTDIYPYNNDVDWATLKTNTASYGVTGFLEIGSYNEASNLLFKLCRLLTTKKLKELGFVYSYNGKDSIWQEEEKSLDRYRQFKSKYPWYFD